MTEQERLGNEKSYSAIVSPLERIRDILRSHEDPYDFAEEDDAGGEITKAIWFRPYGSREYVAFTEKDIRSYKRVTK